MRQFCRRQITPVQGDASSFIIDYNGCVKIPFPKTILQEWSGQVNMKGSIVENWYEAGYVDEYQKWLKDDLHGIVNPTPPVGWEIKDVQMSLHIQTYYFQQEWDQREHEFLWKEQQYQSREFEGQRALAVMLQELTDVMTCLMRDTSLIEKINTLWAMKPSSKLCLLSRT